MEKRPYESGDDWSSRSEKYARSDSYSSGSGYKYGGKDSGRDNSYSSSYSSRGSGNSSWNDSNSSSYRNGSSGYKRDDRYGSKDDRYSSRDDRYKSEGSYGYRSQGGGGGGGYNSRGRGGRSGGYGGGQSGDWPCSSCKFSNYASRTSCFKCRTPKEEGGGGGGRDYNNKWGSGGDSGWKKSSWGNNRDRSYSNDRNNSYNKSWGKADKWENDEDLPDWSTIQKENEDMAAGKWANMPKIVKDLYIEDPTVAAMTEEEVQQFRDDNSNLKVKSSNKDVVVPNPVKLFDQAFASYPEILNQISRQGFDAPSPIQCQGWPILLKGFDMIGTSQTGSGKTLAFLLPALLHICAQPTPRWERTGPTCLVLAPTRELAQQIEREVLKFQYENIRCVCCYGQGDKRIQIQKLNAIAEIVIATPGRLNDFVGQGVVDLSGVSYLVLDEADRMLDMGFEPQVKKIVMRIRPDRQTILTSATWPEEVRALAEKLMKDPIHVIVGSLDLQAVDTITQRVIVCSIMEKENKLMEFMECMTPEDKVIIFVAQKITVDDLSAKLFEAGHKVESMHGGRSQRDRENSLWQLKSGRSKVLIATDVAARGIDIQDITHVLNYDCPKDMEEYVHRVGRTGRAGRKGESLTLMCRDDGRVAGKLIEILEKSEQEIPPELTRMRDRFSRQQEDRDQFRSSRYGGRNGWYSS